MQTTAAGTKRVTIGRASMIGAALLIVILVLVVGSETIDYRSSGSRETDDLQVVRDLSTLALDRDGADVFASPSSHGPDITSLALDRNGADIFSDAPSRGTPDVTTLNLDRDGADIAPAPLTTAPDVTELNLDRDGADIP